MHFAAVEKLDSDYCTAVLPFYSLARKYRALNLFIEGGALEEGSQKQLTHSVTLAACRSVLADDFLLLFFFGKEGGKAAGKVLGRVPMTVGEALQRSSQETESALPKCSSMPQYLSWGRHIHQ